MVNGNPSADASGLLAEQFANAKTSLGNIGLPAINDVLNQYLGDLGTPGSEPGSIQKLFGQARDAVGVNYNNAELSSSNAIATRSRAMGLDFRPDAVKATQESAVSQLEQQRGGALQNLNFQESQAGLSQTDSLLARMGRIESLLANAAFGSGNNALTNAGMMTQSSPWGDSLSGAASGASLGSNFGIFGTDIGALAGGAIGSYGGG